MAAKEAKPAKNTFNLPIFLALALAAALFLGFFFEAPEPKSAFSQSAPVLCKEGDNRECTNSNGCSGFSYCASGAWTSCVIKPACDPGTRIPCYQNSCTSGYKECMVCGNYGACIYNSSSKG